MFPIQSSKALELDFVIQVIDFTEETITSYDSLNYQSHTDICESLRYKVTCWSNGTASLGFFSEP